ncbi:MAG: hypothetical protein ACXWUG_28400 [Polyangiales bacterium]
MMKDPIRCRASVLVRAAIARHLDMPVSSVWERQNLAGDLGLRTVDLALIGISLAEEVGAELEFSRLPEAATVRDLAELASVTMLGLIVPFMQTAAGGR